MFVNHFEFECQSEEFSKFIRELIDIYWFEIDRMNYGKENNKKEFLVSRSDEHMTILHRWDEDDGKNHDAILELNKEIIQPDLIKVTIDLSDDAIQFNWSRHINNLISTML